VTSQYLHEGASESAYLLPNERAKHLVLRATLEQIDTLVKEGWDLTYCLEYAVQLGKHVVTERLLAQGFPVTRQALVNAARRRGPGMELLLAAIRTEDKPQALSAGMSFRLAAQDFEKAYAMLDAGAAPDRYFISSAFTGSQASDNFEALFRDALDRVLGPISKEALAQSHLEFLVECGRPVHIERVLEKLEQPVVVLMPRLFALGSEGPARALREFGAIVDDHAIEFCARRMDWIAESDPARYLERLCNNALADGFQGAIRLRSVRPIVEALLTKHAHWYRRGYECAPATYDRLRVTLNALIPCLIPEERDNLLGIIVEWNAGKAESSTFTAEAMDDLTAMIRAVSDQTMDYGQVAEAPTAP
jgi:hypothetical protein